MSTRSSMWQSLGGVAVLAAGMCSMISSLTTVHADEDASTPAYFTQKVKPILDAKCARCHGAYNHRGGYNMNTREAMLKGSHHGPAIVPGQPNASFLLKLVNHQGPADDPMPMPPAPRPKLSDAELATLAAWIKAGAVTPADPLFSPPQ